MNLQTTIYKQNTATDSQVLTHLLKCDNDFVQTLSKKVDIPAYSTRIVQNSITFEAWENDELVGLVAAYFNDQVNKTGFITNVSTVKDQMGKGIASNLMKRCIEYAEENNFREIGLEVSAENENAIQLYKKFNFIQSAIKDDLIIMKLNLN